MKHLATQFVLFFLVLFSVQIATAQNGETLFSNDYLHEIRFTFEEANFWEIMANNYSNGIGFDGGGSAIIYLMGTVEIDGTIVDSIGLRQKGYSSHFSSNQFKKSLKIDFNEFAPGTRYEGLRKVNLNNGVGDPAMQRDLLCFDMIREAGGIAPRVAHAKVYINDYFWGTYILIEQIDKEFLDANFANGNGNLFKNNSWSNLEWLGDNPTSYQDIFQLKTNEEINDWTRFVEFMDLLNNSSNIEFEEEIQDYFNVDLYLRVLAIDVMTSNWDSYIEHGRNWYMYQDSSTNAFQWIPWDYNLAMGGEFNSFGIIEPPLDSICPLDVDFTYGRDSLTIYFLDQTDSMGMTWFWDFGDDSTSTEQHPEHTYAEEDQYNVCLTVSLTIGDTLCTKTACKNVDFFFDPNDCPTVVSGESPYDGSDPIFVLVIEQDPFCCEQGWDGLCQDQYDAIANGNGGGGGGGNAQAQINDFPLLYNNPEKKLINRLMNVPAFRERYLNISCEILENNFTLERLEPIIDHNTSLISEAVYEEPNGIFDDAFFDYDATNTLGDGGVSLPPLKYYIITRTQQLLEDLDQSNHDCDLRLAQNEWQDVVINEFMASNDANSGIADPSGSFADWIELYNNTNETIDLGTYYLSDNLDSLNKWQFDLNTQLAPDSYLIVWADKDLEEEGIHADFKLEKDGESLYLTHEDGTFLDSLSFDAQETSVASARIPNGTGDFVKQTATFAINNETPPNATANPFAARNIRAYPNPTRGSFYVDLTNINQEPVTILVSNSLGQIVEELHPKNNDLIEFSTENYGAGLFTLQVIFSDKSSVLQKILVIK